MRRRRWRQPEQRNDFTWLRTRVYLELTVFAVAAVLIILLAYSTLWEGRAGDWIVNFLMNDLGMTYEDAYQIYNSRLRANKLYFWWTAVAIVFLLFVWFFIGRFLRYFREINTGINGLLDEDAKEITLSPELSQTAATLQEVRDELNQRELDTRSAEQRKDELVAYLAHDIRTPLTSVIGYLNLLKDDRSLSEEQRSQYLATVLKNADQIDTLTSELFEIARHNARDVSLQIDWIDLSVLVIQLSEEFVPAAEARELRLHVQVQPEIVISADRSQLARVLSNLLKNAIAHAEAGSTVRIAAGLVDKWTFVTVENVGPTIPPEDLDRVFDKFVRLDRARRTLMGGAGLGLAISREIVHLHNGFINAGSKDNVTTFAIYLPSAKAAPGRALH